MASPSRRKVSLPETHGFSVEDSPIKGIPNRPLPMGSIFVPRTEVECRKVATPRRKLSLASKEGIKEGEGSKSVEIVEMKTVNARTPSRRITRSITIISESKEQDSPSIKEVLRSTSHNKKSVKRTSDHVEEDSSIKKNKMEMKSNPEWSILTTQNYSFIIHPENRFGGTINVFYKHDVISVLNAKLNATQKEMFRSSCFGHFLQMREMRIQHQIIHKMLMLEIRQPNEDEMWFDLDGKIARFSIHEFCIVSGLKCAGDESLNLYKIGGCRLRDKYFSKLKNVYRNDVEHVFKELPLDTPDEDVVKIGILYFITMYLFTATQPNVVNNDVMRLVDSPHMNSFPWGKELFQLTFRNLKNTFKNSESIDGDNKVILTYRLYGFPLAFQIWVYESIPSLSRKFCKRIRYGSPRILNWTNDESRVTAANLDKFLSQLEEVEVVDMQPNDLEKGAAYYIGLGERESVTMKQRIPSGKHNHATRKIKVKSTVTTADNAFIPCTYKPTTEATKLGDAHIIELIQQMTTQVQQIQSNQIQIIDTQNEIKSSITRIEGELDTKYNVLMEVVRMRNTDNQDTERSGKSTKGAESLNTKVLAKARQSSTRQKDLFAKGVTGRNEIQEHVPLIEDSFDKLKHISTDVDNSDEIQFTEEDLMKVDQIVKSVRSKKGKCVDQSGGPSKNPDEIHKKILGGDEAVMKILFLDEANADNPAAQNHELLTDAIQSPTAVKHYSATGYHTNAKYSLFPFSADMAQPGDDDVAAFERWFGDGYKPGLIKFKFLPSKDVIKPPMHFGPYVIASKTWWHELWEPNVYLRDSHLNICFYYFRKMLRHSRLSAFKCTTTDSYFAPMVRNAFKSCMEDIYSVSKYKSLVEIASGDFIHCNTSWSEVDHVLLPIMMEKKAHWVLGDFNVRDRSLTVYNSSRLTIRDRMVSNDMQAFAFVLPCLMVNMNVWEPIVLNGVPCVEPLDVIIATGIPQDDYGHDCGLYVIKYAEFIIHQQLETIYEKFDPKASRSQLAVQLYTYAREKLTKGYETDCDLVPRSVRRARKLSSARNV